MIEPGKIVSYYDIVKEEKTNLQRGMNYKFRGGHSIILMSLRPGAPYADRIEDGGKTLIYEGHDVDKRAGILDKKSADQPYKTSSGRLTQNGKFFEAAISNKKSNSEPELVKVYEKIRTGIWIYNGKFQLIDAWEETSNNRTVFKFKLVPTANIDNKDKRSVNKNNLSTRIIPTPVKLEVWKRDQGKCVLCGSKENLHFDHIIPYSKGGSSLVAENIQLLCAKHNLEKRDKII